MSNNHPFSQYLRILGKGPRTRRSLTVEEARTAMQIIWQGEVTERQLGAFLLLMRANGESTDELVGFLQQIKQQLTQSLPEQPMESPDLDWCTYSGKWRYPPYFLLALKLLAENGYKVLLHGDSGQFTQRAYAQEWLNPLGFQVMPADEMPWQDKRVCYQPLEQLAQPIREILHLKSELGVRTVFNTLVKLLNPFRAPASVQGIYHKGVENLHHAAAAYNGTGCNLVFKGEGGEAEIRPDALIKLYFSLPEQTQPIELKIPAVIERQKCPDVWQHQDLLDLWAGSKVDLYGEQSVICTATVALMAMQCAKLNTAQAVAIVRDDGAQFFQQNYQIAQSMWQQRSSVC